LRALTRHHRRVARLRTQWNNRTSLPRQRIDAEARRLAHVKTHTLRDSLSNREPAVGARRSRQLGRPPSATTSAAPARNVARWIIADSHDCHHSAPRPQHRRAISYTSIPRVFLAIPCHAPPENAIPRSIAPVTILRQHDGELRNSCTSLLAQGESAAARKKSRMEHTLKHQPPPIRGALAEANVKPAPGQDEYRHDVRPSRCGSAQGKSDSSVTAHARERRHR